jgi:hypothetical protein
MTAEYKKYYFYSHIDPDMEPLGICHASTTGEAIQYFATIKNMNIHDFLKIYAIGFKNEHK